MQSMIMKAIAVIRTEPRRFRFLDLEILIFVSDIDVAKNRNL